MRLKYNLIFFLLLVALPLHSYKVSAQANNSLTQNNQNNYNTESHLKIKYDSCFQLYKKGLYAKSLKETLELLKESEKTNNKYYQVLANFLIANVFSSLDNKNKSIIHYKKSVGILDNLKENQLESSDFTNINLSKYRAEILLGLGSKYQQLKKLDSAEIYYNKISEIQELNNDLLSIKAKSYNNLSGIYIRRQNLDKATHFTKKAISIHQKTNNKVSEASALSNLASIYLMQKKYNKAKEVYFESLNLIEKNNSNKATRFKEDIYFNLAWTLYLLKDYTAYDFQEKSYSIKDSLRAKEINRVLEEMYAQNQLDLEKERTALAEEQRKLIEAKDSKATLLLGVLTFLILLISGVVIYNYKLRQKNLQLKLSESNLLQQQSIERLKSEAQIKILNATIDGKESERKLIAETLHDNVSALLSSANMHLSATKKQYNGNTPIEVEKTRDIILEASQKVRDLSHNLVSSILLKFGLEYAVKDVAKKYSNSQLNFEVSAQNINRYNQDFEIKIFNIIQELINNIIKHSNANHAKIALKEEKDQLTILIRDDGVGFAPSSSSIKDGIGLNQIDARIHVLNGKFIISSEINKGTEAIITVPIQQQKKEYQLTSVS